MGELRVCPSCGYERGFHVSFFQQKGGEVSIRMICPNCGQSYDIGWKEKDIKEFSVTEGPAY
ncbi:hypothetical protein ACFL2P_03970 [Candidatus Moduliflexota bacterium]